MLTSPWQTCSVEHHLELSQKCPVTPQLLQIVFVDNAIDHCYISQLLILTTELTTAMRNTPKLLIMLCNGNKTIHSWILSISLIVRCSTHTYVTSNVFLFNSFYLIYVYNCNIYISILYDKNVH